jgi:LPXTG-motif cell wall-anchored protein
VAALARLRSIRAVLLALSIEGRCVSAPTIVILVVRSLTRGDDLDLWWLFSWEGAARHPVRTIVVMFPVSALGLAAVAYATVSEGNVVSAIAVGVLGGVLFTLYIAREIREQRGTASERSRLRRSLSGLQLGATVAIALLGLITIALGAFSGSIGLALAGFPYVLLALIFALSRRRRRK